METSLWHSYQVEGSAEARDELLTKHLRLVHHVARQVMRSTHVDAEFDELVSAGAIGLMKAVERFEPERGLAFSTFAAPRIRGAILDDLRRRDHAPRSIRRKQREISNARQALMTTLDRAPRDDETATALGIDVEKLWQWRRETEQAVQISLDRPLDPSSGRSTTPEEILVSSAPDEIEEHISRKEEMEILKEEILELKEQERIVLSLYYFEELKLHEIATILGVTESRVSQIRSKAIKTLRDRLARLRDGESDE